MKANKIITLVFIGLFSICSISCNDKPRNHSQSTTEQSNTLQTKSTKNESTTVATSKDSDDDFFSTLLLYVSLGLNVLVICILIKLHLRLNRHKKYLGKLKDDLEKNAHMQNTTHNLKSKSLLSTDDVNRIISNYFNNSKNLNSILDSIRELQKLDEQEKSHTQTTLHQNHNSNRTTLYASSAKDATREFYSVTEQIVPEKTIFELHVNNCNHAEYKVTQTAFRMVLTDQSFLEAACDITKKGSSKLINVENGIAEKQSNGKWLITKKAKVTIE